MFHIIIMNCCSAAFVLLSLRLLLRKICLFALQLAAKRASKIGLPVGGTKEAEDERLGVLIDWASNAFEPLGMSGLIPNSVGLFPIAFS